MKRKLEELRELHLKLTKPQAEKFFKMYGAYELISETKIDEAIAICKRTINKKNSSQLALILTKNKRRNL